MCTGFFILFEIFAPELAFRIVKPDEKQMIEYIESNVELTENGLIIPSIGVDMEIGKDKEFLDYGGWVQGVNNDGRPNLIAIHRFGWNTLSPEEKIRQTFYHVNKLKQGDVVYIIWDEQLYTYYIQKITERINNPQAATDLIIYTCRFMSSSQRVIVLLED